MVIIGGLSGIYWQLAYNLGIWVTLSYIWCFWTTYFTPFYVFVSANTTEACLQHEITRLTSENFDLREKIENLNDNIRRLKKMLKTYMKRIEDSGENPRDLDSVNETNYEQVKVN